MGDILFFCADSVGVGVGVGVGVHFFISMHYLLNQLMYFDQMCMNIHCWEVGKS